MIVKTVVLVKGVLDREKMTKSASGPVAGVLNSIKEVEHSITSRLWVVLPLRFG